MNVIEEQLASYEECYKNRIKMETREKQREQKVTLFTSQKLFGGKC